MKIAMILTYLLLFTYFAVLAWKTKTGNHDKVGKLPINRLAFLAGKFAMIICWLFPAFDLGSNFSMVEVPESVRWIALTLFISGIVFAFASSLNLGAKALKLGVPKDGDTTELASKGLYRISRNPIYIGFFLMIGASLMFAPNIINFTFGILAIIVHHRITLSEERFLKERFGESWTDYKNCVRRYI